jgi:amino acid adenylation domain-containing protein
MKAAPLSLETDMSERSRAVTTLPPEQEAIRAKCFHPTGTFVEFKKDEVEQSIPERFEKIVQMYPDRIAVASTELRFTYTELNQVANRVARAILAQPGKGEEPVALLFEHGVFIIAAILGILKAGRIYVPLDPALPPTRTADMVEDSRAKLLLTNTKHLSQAQRLAQDGQHVLNCDDVDVSVATANLDRPISSETCALILYTSGSTGRPKGVLHNHRNVLVETRNYTNDVRICPEDRLSLCQSCSFANSIRNIYGALLNGATLFPYDLATEGFPSLAEWLRTNRITIFHTLATVIRRIRDTIAADATFPALRILRFGGEPTNGEEVKYFQRHFSPNCVLMNVIGLTETFTIRRYFVTQEWRPGDTKVPLGYGVPDKEVFLLDEAGQEVSANQIGEIAVRSKHLALGYWRRPDLTRAAFIPDPGGGDERLYLTGDLGMMRPDGCLIHMGRKDFQVKIRGNRVEVAEIEAELLELDSIQAAVVHAQADDGGEQRLVAYIVPAAGKAPTISELRRALAPTLSDYMIPSVFVFLETLPVVPNGRVDRRALPDPGKSRPKLDAPFVAPRTPVEEKMAQIWAEVLALDRVGIQDNFFELGGHSLAATRIISQVIKHFQLELPLRSLFGSPTVAEMAAVITEHQAKKFGEKDLERILAELESMSEEEAKSLLAAERPT